MSQENLRHAPDANADGQSNIPEVLPVRGHSFGWKVWQVLKTVQARLRFVAILVGIGLVIGNWTLLSAYWEKWTRPAGGQEAADADVEYFCPMHPTVVSDNPKEKCP